MYRDTRSPPPQLLNQNFHIERRSNAWALISVVGQLEKATKTSFAGHIPCSRAKSPRSAG